MPSKKIEIKKLPRAILRFLELIAQHFFVSLAAVLVLILILAGLCFWHYYLKEKGKTFQPPPSLRINQQLLEKVSSVLAEKEAAFEQVEAKDFPDPFRRIGD